MKPLCNFQFYAGHYCRQPENDPVHDPSIIHSETMGHHRFQASPSDATQPAADDVNCPNCHEPGVLFGHMTLMGYACRPASDDCRCRLRVPSAAASPTAANENSPNEGADASQAVRSLPSPRLLTRAADAIEDHECCKWFTASEEDPRVCSFFVGWFQSWVDHEPSAEQYRQQFYALVKEK